MNIAEMSMNDKVSLLKELYHDIASKGQDGDTLLAHINPEEALLLKAHGGSGTINPNTGLPEYKKAVKTVVKVAKKIAPIAAVAAGAYYGVGALTAASSGVGLAGGTFPTLLTTAGGVGTATSAFGGLTTAASFLGSNAGTIMQGAGLLSNVSGNIQDKKYASEQSGYMRESVEQANKADEARNRYNNLLQQRSRLNIIRQGRIQQGQITASTAGSGMGSGTSSFRGSVGSVGSQISANLGNINVAQDVGNQITGFNMASANAGSNAYSAGAKGDMWKGVQTLGGTLFDNSERISNLAGKVGSIFT